MARTLYSSHWSCVSKALTFQATVANYYLRDQEGMLLFDCTWETYGDMLFRQDAGRHMHWSGYLEAGTVSVLAS